MPQLVALYLGRRDQYGAPLPPEPAAGGTKTARGYHEYRCFNLGIRDPDVVEELWRELQAAAPAAAGPRRKKRR